MRQSFIDLPSTPWWSFANFIPHAMVPERCIYEVFSPSESFGFNSDIDLFAENLVCFDQYRRMLVKLIGGCVLLYCPAWPWLRMHAPVLLIKVREKGVGPVFQILLPRFPRATDTPAYPSAIVSSRTLQDLPGCLRACLGSGLYAWVYPVWKRLLRKADRHLPF